MTVGSYVIYYTQYRDSVRIERIVHGARDRDALFSDPEDGATAGD